MSTLPLLDQYLSHQSVASFKNVTNYSAIFNVYCVFSRMGKCVISLFPFFPSSKMDLKFLEIHKKHSLSLLTKLKNVFTLAKFYTRNIPNIHFFYYCSSSGRYSSIISFISFLIFLHFSSIHNTIPYINCTIFHTLRFW